MVRYNKSKTYLLPLLSEIVDFDLNFFKHLKNTYIFDSQNKYQNCLFILHKFSFKNPEFTNYEHKLIKNNYFVDLIDIDDNVLYIFKFPEEYLDEYNHYINGEYSKFGEDAKELILKFYTRLYKNNPNAINFLIKIKQILFKDESLKRKLEKELNVKLDKDVELGDKMSKKSETFNITNEEKKDI